MEYLDEDTNEWTIFVPKSRSSSLESSKMNGEAGETPVTSRSSSLETSAPLNGEAAEQQQQQRRLQENGTDDSKAQVMSNGELPDY